MNKLKQLLYFKLDDFVSRADACIEADWDEQQFKPIMKMMAEDVKFLVGHFKQLLENRDIYEGLMINETEVSNKERAVVQSRLPSDGENSGGEE